MSRSDRTRLRPGPWRGLAGALASALAATGVTALIRPLDRSLSGRAAGMPPHPVFSTTYRQGTTRMAEDDRRPSDVAPGDRAPGDESGAADAVIAGIPGYTIGLALAALLTAASFLAAGSGGIVWAPGVPVVLIVLAIAQMGVHIVFFMHITTGPDSLNNAMALAFGTLIVLLLLSGTIWIMYHLNHNMMDMPQMMHMQH